MAWWHWGLIVIGALALLGSLAACNREPKQVRAAWSWEIERAVAEFCHGKHVTIQFDLTEREYKLSATCEDGAFITSSGLVDESEREYTARTLERHCPETAGQFRPDTWSCVSAVWFDKYGTPRR